MSRDPHPLTTELAHWREVDGLFRAALELPESERAAYVSANARGSSVREQVLSLLRVDAQEISWLDRRPEGPFSLPATAFEAASAGDQIGRFRILGVLGEGGMSIVYSAEDLEDRLEREVALKFLRHPFADSESRARFLNEGRILSRLEHRSIARIYDATSNAEGVPYLVMERVDGTPIDRHCHDRNLGLSDRIELFREVCEAVSFAHRNLVVHRDVKPSNILVTAAGEVKLLDFGIAKLLDASGKADLTRSAMGPMTPRYASPEQLQGKPVTTASDVFSLGILLFELLAGPAPDSRSSEPSSTGLQPQPLPRPSSAIEQRIAAGRHSGPRASEVRGDLDRIVAKALAEDPEDRYSSVERLAADLERFLGGFPVEAREPSLGYRLRRFARRHALGVSLATAASVALLALTGALALTGQRLQTERDRAHQERSNAQQVTEVLIDLFALVDPAERRGASVTARELLDRGVERLSADWKGEPALQATLQGTLGELYQNLGLFQQADELRSTVLETRRSLLGERHPDTLTSLSDLGATALESGDFARAESLLSEAHRGQAELLAPTDPRRSRTVARLALTHLRLGSPTRARELARASIQAHRTAGETRSETYVTILNLDAWASRALGELAEARALHEEAVALGTEVLGFEHPAVLSAAKNLASALMTDDPNRTEALLIDILAAERQLFAGDHPRLGFSLNQLGVLYQQMGRIPEARARISESLSMRRRLFGDSHLSLAPSLLQLATLDQNIGDYEAAEAGIREAQAIVESELPPESPDRTRPMLQLGGLFLAQGRSAEARPLLEQAYRTRRAAAPPHPGRIAEAAVLLGRFHRRFGNLDRAEALFAEALELLESGQRGESPQAAALRETLAELRAEAPAEPGAL